jgi:multicomponent Na+:H+ antiporter subunit B
MILRVGAKVLIPLILVYALYVQFHGELGPGGAFQAGVIAAAAFILHALVFGIRETERVIPVWLVRALTAVGTLIFGGTGVAAMLQGGNFLDYNALNWGYPTGGQHMGIILIELGVLTAVFGSMLLIFYSFAGRVPELDDKDW